MSWDARAVARGAAQIQRPITSISATKAATTHPRRSLRNRSIETGLCRV